MATQPSDEQSLHYGPAEPSMPLAVQAKLAMLVPIVVLAVVGMHASGATYGRDGDAKLNAFGRTLELLALLAAAAVALSIWSRPPAWARRALVLVAIALTIFGLVWGLPKEAHLRSVAHCACEGG